VADYIPSLSELLAPSTTIRDGKIKRDRPSEAYIDACIAEGKKPPERKPAPPPDPISADKFGPETQLHFAKLAARDGDWRALRGTKPTPKMKDLFVTLRAKYREHLDRHGCPPGQLVLALDFTAEARSHINEIKRREIFYPDIDTSRTCSLHGNKDCSTCKK
jgi:hypothetical protein